MLVFVFSSLFLNKLGQTKDNECKGEKAPLKVVFSSK